MGTISISNRLCFDVAWATRALTSASQRISIFAFGSQYKGAFDHAQKLACAKDPQEFWQLQSDFAKA